MGFASTLGKAVKSTDWKGLASNAGKAIERNKKPLAIAGAAAGAGFLAGKSSDEKTAAAIPGSLGHTVGSAIGKAGKFLKEDVKWTGARAKQRAANVAGGLSEGANSGARRNFMSGLKKPERGASLSAHRESQITKGRELTEGQKARIHSGVSAQSKEDLAARTKKFQDAKNKAKASQGFGFARKHPIATGVGAALLAHHLMGSSQDGAGSPQAGNPVSPY
jgi:hypothetical protein